MEYLEINNMSFELDEDGYLFHPNQWKREVMKVFVERIGKRNFNSTHECVIDLICDRVKSNGHASAKYLLPLLPSFMDDLPYSKLTNFDKAVLLEFIDEFLKLY